MASLFFFSVSLLASALCLKVEALNEAKAQAAEVEHATRLVLGAPTPAVGAPWKRGEWSLDPAATVLANARAPGHGEVRFGEALRVATTALGCCEVAQIHLPVATPRAGPQRPHAMVRRALAALRPWRADFAICEVDSLQIVAVVRLRPDAALPHDLQRANLDFTLKRALAAAQLPEIVVDEASASDPEHIASLIRPHLADRQSRGEVVETDRA